MGGNGAPRSLPRTSLRGDSLIFPILRKLSGNLPAARRRIYAIDGKIWSKSGYLAGRQAERSKIFTDLITGKITATNREIHCQLQGNTIGDRASGIVQPWSAARRGKPSYWIGFAPIKSARSYCWAPSAIPAKATFITTCFVDIST